MKRAATLATALAVAITTGCSVQSSPTMPSQTTTLQELAGTGAGKIDHIVWIVQENRSFDNLFYGFPGADTATTGKNSKGKTITLKPVSLKRIYNIAPHGASDVRRLPGHRIDARQEVPHGRLRQRRRFTAALPTRSTFTLRTPRRAPISRWRINTC